MVYDEMFQNWSLISSSWALMGVQLVPYIKQPSAYGCPVGPLYQAAECLWVSSWPLISSSRTLMGVQLADKSLCQSWSVDKLYYIRLARYTREICVLHHIRQRRYFKGRFYYLSVFIIIYIMKYIYWQISQRKITIFSILLIPDLKKRKYFGKISLHTG